MKADPSREIPHKLAANLMLVSLSALAHSTSWYSKFWIGQTQFCETCT